jgi:hypothetical protein
MSPGNTFTIENEYIPTIPFGTSPRFKVETNGDTWYLGTKYNFSDEAFKENIRTIENPLSKVLKLRGVTYDSKAGKKAELPDSLSTEIKAKITSEKSRQLMGVVAQEVEKVVPEVVRTYESGMMGVAYDQLAGLLIEAIKELESEVSELRDEISNNASLRSATSEGISNPIVSACKLFQNAPNPFSQTTQIKYYLPESVKNASLNIYNLQGKQLKQIAIAGRGDGYQLISGSEFTAGIYLYALIADGQEVDVKRMILTE